MILVFLELFSCQPATVERESLLGLVLGHSMSGSLQCCHYHVKNKRLKPDNHGKFAKVLHSLERAQLMDAM